MPKARRPRKPSPAPESYTTGMFLTMAQDAWAEQYNVKEWDTYTDFPWEEIDWKHTDREIAEDVGCDASTVWFYRHKLNKPPYSTVVSELRRDAIRAAHADGHRTAGHLMAALRRLGVPFSRATFFKDLRALGLSLEDGRKTTNPSHLEGWYGNMDHAPARAVLTVRSADKEAIAWFQQLTSTERGEVVDKAHALARQG